MIIVTLHKAADPVEFIALLNQHGYKYTPRIRRVFSIACDIDEFTLKNYKGIRGIEENMKMDLQPHAIDIMNTGITTSQKEIPPSPATWGRHRIIRKYNPFKKQSEPRKLVYDMPYRCRRTGEGVDIYMIDEGLDSTHQEFIGGRFEYAGGFDVDANNTVQVGETSFTLPPGISGGHGHLCASVAAGNDVGMAPDARLFFIQMRTTWGSTLEDFMGYFSLVHTHYMSRAADNRPAVVSVSMGTLAFTEPSPSMEALIDDMFDDGLVMCVSAGNSQWDFEEEHVMPAEAHPEIIVVGGTDPYDMPMYKYAGWGTGVGAGVDIYAPGESQYCAFLGGSDTYLLSSGTSFSCPLVAGVLACMLQGYQRLTTRAQAQALQQKLKDNSLKGALQFQANFPNSVINDRLLYLDPHATIEEIEGLNPL
jgi:hypothetical protein